MTLEETMALQIKTRMKHRIALFAAALVFISAVFGGSISGSVRAQGATPDDGAGGSAGSYGSRRYKFVERIDYTQLQDFVISLEGSDIGSSEAGASRTAKVVQRDASFDPHVLPIAVGTSVKWPNADDIYHNVFSMSDTKDFNLGLYGKEKTPVLLFDKVGRVDVFCAIHTQMHCIILVLPNPYFAMADARGRYVIKDVPAGTYRLKAWQERVPSKIKEVIVPPDGDVKVDFVLGLGELPKY
jgi:plastocyanin